MEDLWVARSLCAHLQAWSEDGGRPRDHIRRAASHQGLSSSFQHCKSTRLFLIQATAWRWLGFYSSSPNGGKLWHIVARKFRVNEDGCPGRRGNYLSTCCPFLHFNYPLIFALQSGTLIWSKQCSLMCRWRGNWQVLWSSSRTQKLGPCVSLPLCTLTDFWV